MKTKITESRIFDRKISFLLQYSRDNPEICEKSSNDASRKNIKESLIFKILRNLGSEQVVSETSVMCEN